MTKRKKKVAKAEARPKKRGTKVAKISAVAAVRKSHDNVKKDQITLRLDADVIDYFRAMGSGYQGKINGCLGMPMVDMRIRNASDIAGTPFYEESRSHEAMGNRIFRPRKEQITLRVDADVMKFYRSKGKGYQSRMNRVLRLLMVEMMRADEPKDEEEMDS